MRGKGSPVYFNGCTWRTILAMTYKTMITVAVGVQSAFKNSLEFDQYSTSSFGATNKVEGITRIGKPVTDTAEILHATFSWRERPRYAMNASKNNGYADNAYESGTMARGLGRIRYRNSKGYRIMESFGYQHIAEGTEIQRTGRGVRRQDQEQSHVFDVVVG